MHDQAFSASQVTHNGVAGDGAATVGEFDRRVFAAIERERAHAMGVARRKTFPGQQQGIWLFSHVPQ